MYNFTFTLCTRHQTTQFGRHCLIMLRVRSFLCLFYEYQSCKLTWWGHCSKCSWLFPVLILVYSRAYLPVLSSSMMKLPVNTVHSSLNLLLKYIYLHPPPTHLHTHRHIYHLIHFDMTVTMDIG